jgi:prepilin peptidase CpaA
LEDLLSAPLQAKVALAVLAVALLVSVITDLRKRLILNAVTYPALVVVAGCFFWLGGLPLLLESALGVLVSAGPLALTATVNSKWMGWGDVKLMAVAGAVSGAAAGWPFSLAVLLYVAVAGGVQSAVWMLAAKLRGHERPKYVPYGIAIATGTTIAFIWGGSLF